MALPYSPWPSVGAILLSAAELERLYPVPTRVATIRPLTIEQAAYPEENLLVGSASPARQQEFHAARRAMRLALGALGASVGAILRKDNGAPDLPAGVIGSIAHCAGFCCAVASWGGLATGLGIDVEQIAEFEPALVAYICTPHERERLHRLPPVGPEWALVAFCAKEAAFKCSLTLQSHCRDFRDLVVAFAADQTFAGGSFSVELVQETRPFGSPGSWPRISGRWTTDGVIVVASATEFEYSSERLVSHAAARALRR